MFSPFVDAGVMAGAERGASAAALDRVLGDRSVGDALVARARAFTSDGSMPCDGRAAERAVDEILALLDA